MRQRLPGKLPKLRMIMFFPRSPRNMQLALETPSRPVMRASTMKRQGCLNNKSKKHSNRFHLKYSICRGRFKPIIQVFWCECSGAMRTLKSCHCKSLQLHLEIAQDLLFEQNCFRCQNAPCGNSILPQNVRTFYARARFPGKMSAIPRI